MQNPERQTILVTRYRTKRDKAKNTTQKTENWMSNTDPTTNPGVN